MIGVTGITCRMKWSVRIQYGQAMEITKFLRGIPPWSDMGTLLGQRLLAVTQALQVIKQSIAYVIVLRWET